jgi:acyl-CoA synthetase (AMP-forming)/AMP-acid ligase II
MSCWNIAETFYQFGESPIADNPALIHDGKVVSFAQLRQRGCAIASWMQELGLPAGAHVGHYLRNSNAYMEAFTGTGLAGLGHVNVNFRYLEEELIDLCNGLDIAVIVYDAEFAERIATIKPRLTKSIGFLEVDEAASGAGSQASPINDFAISLSQLYPRDISKFQRSTSSDDLILIATGGTTGLPKGTQWRHEDMWKKMNISTSNALAALGIVEHPETIEEHVANVASLPPGMGFLSLSPLMHGAGLMMALLMMSQGSALVTLPGKKFDADATLNAIKKHHVGGMVLVGDAFAMPLIEVLDRRTDEKLLESLVMLVSSGASLSDDSKAALLRHNPGLILFDTLGSSEASGYAFSTPEAGVFTPMPTTRVLDDQQQDVVPGSETIGMAYSGGHMPIGYYNEPEKSAETFVEVEGQRYVMTGDRCQVREDGKLILLGRDSTVINTGGEKVYTVEVERVLVEHPAITDVLVVGLPHPRFGKMVVAVVEGPGLSAETLDVPSIQAHAAKQLADYKIPKAIFAIDSLQRAPNGKPDYPFVTAFAEAQAAAS